MISILLVRWRRTLSLMFLYFFPDAGHFPDGYRDHHEHADLHMVAARRRAGGGRVRADGGCVVRGGRHPAAPGPRLGLDTPHPQLLLKLLLQQQRLGLQHRLPARVLRDGDRGAGGVLRRGRGHGTQRLCLPERLPRARGGKKKKVTPQKHTMLLPGCLLLLCFPLHTIYTIHGYALYTLSP